MIPVLYDGWPLVHQPNSPAALHLLALLAALPAGSEAHLALPGPPPDWLPENIQAAVHPLEAAQHLRWEQRTLPALVRALKTRLLHLTSPGPALFSPAPCLLSPCGFEPEARRPSQPARGIWGHLAAALEQGGQSRIAARLWPSDLPPPAGQNSLLPPLAAPLPAPAASLPASLPEDFILYHGPLDSAALRRVLESWSWAATAIGEQTRLVCLGFDDLARARLDSLREDYPLVEALHLLPALPTPQIPALYARASAVFHPFDDPPWGGPVRQALAAGRAVIAAESPRNDALAGPAAYLVSASDTRLLGAALITVVVEESVSESLAAAAAARSAPWDPASFAARLARLYHLYSKTAQEE